MPNSGYFGHEELPMRKYIVLADGENLVFRYQAMLQAHTKNPNVYYIPDAFIWHQNLVAQAGWYPVRVNYYTSFTGGDDQLADLERKIAEVPIFKKDEEAAQVCPRVFKKLAKSKKSKMVDISICIDALRHSYHRDVDAIFLLSGDSDYIPLIKEVMRNGTQVWLSAFSDGLSPELPPTVDKFTFLDALFFQTAKQFKVVTPQAAAWSEVMRSKGAKG
jgi:uncharacterized LabA/DUF88 family protein